MLINEIHFNRNGRNYRMYTHESFIMLDEWTSDLKVARDYSFRLAHPLFKTFAEIGAIVFRKPGGDVPATLDESASVISVTNIAQLLEIIRQVGNFS